MRDKPMFKDLKEDQPEATPESIIDKLTESDVHILLMKLEDKAAALGMREPAAQLPVKKDQLDGGGNMSGPIMTAEAIAYDPADVPTNTTYICQDDGNGPYDDGDGFIKVTDSNGNTKTIQLWDYSAGGIC